VTELGYGKRTPLDEYRVQSRGGLGLKNLEITDKNGRVIEIAQVNEDKELLLITEQGKIMRTPTGDIRTIGRATQGVRLMDLDDADKVVSVALVDKDEEAAKDTESAASASDAPPADATPTDEAPASDDPPAEE
jgi:DNA gyrase subunit A